MTNDGTVDGSLVREFDSRGGNSGIGGIDIRGDVGGRLDGIVACDVDRADKGVEVASGNVVGVVPIDHASSPLNSAWGSSLDTSRPYTGEGSKLSVWPEIRGGGVVPDLNTSGSGWVKSNPIRVDGIGLLQCANDVSVDQPRQGVELPVDLNRKKIQGDCSVKSG